MQAYVAVFVVLAAGAFVFKGRGLLLPALVLIDPTVHGFIIIAHTCCVPPRETTITFVRFTVANRRARTDAANLTIEHRQASAASISILGG